MTTLMVQPDFLDVNTWRNVVKHNKRDIKKVLFTIEAPKDTHIPHILVEHGFFDSTSRVRKNQPTLVRNTELDKEVIKLSWAVITIITPAT